MMSLIRKCPLPMCVCVCACVRARAHTQYFVLGHTPCHNVYIPSSDSVCYLNSNLWYIVNSQHIKLAHTALYGSTLNCLLTVPHLPPTPSSPTRIVTSQDIYMDLNTVVHFILSPICLTSLSCNVPPVKN